MQTILVTGHAGFIGSNLVKRLFKEMQEGTIVGIDNLNDYYDPSLKAYRLQELEKAKPAGVNYISIKGSIADRELINKLFQEYQPQIVVNLAAQAGVRYSATHPYECLQNNVTGFLNVLEACRNHGVGQLIFASSSSVYGADAQTPFSEEERADRPVSLYAATKRADELMAHAYSQLYGLRVTGLRFFTVYGPWGRPDMAPMLFARAIMAGEPIEVFNGGEMYRDFTYIDDVVEGIVRVIGHSGLRGSGVSFQGQEKWPCPETPPAASPYAIYNIGAGQPVKLMDFISELEQALGRKAVKRFLPMQPGDVPATHADTTAFARAFGFTPQVTLHEGLRKFAEWYKAEEITNY